MFPPILWVALSLSLWCPLSTEIFILGEVRFILFYLLLRMLLGAYRRCSQSSTLTSDSFHLHSSEFCLRFVNVFSITCILNKPVCLRLQIPRAVTNSEKQVHTVQLIKASTMKTIVIQRPVSPPLGSNLIWQNKSISPSQVLRMTLT